MVLKRNGGASAPRIRLTERQSSALLTYVVDALDETDPPCARELVDSYSANGGKALDFTWTPDLIGFLLDAVNSADDDAERSCEGAAADRNALTAVFNKMRDAVRLA